MQVAMNCFAAWAFVCDFFRGSEQQFISNMPIDLGYLHAGTISNLIKLRRAYEARGDSNQPIAFLS